MSELPFAVLPRHLAHDPGGKVMLSLEPGVVGDAEFYGDNNQYRLWLSRWWGDQRGPFALWIGMNPSTAAKHVDDPTVRRECLYSRRHLQVNGYVKCNVADYRATKPSELLKVEPRSDRNLDTILRFAARADRIIVCYGALHKKLEHCASIVVGALEAAGCDLHCLGYTKDGAPRHPLYLRGDTELVPFTRGAKPNREIDQ
jgi:hypothetical protein